MSSTPKTPPQTPPSKPPPSSPPQTTTLLSLPNELLIEILSRTTYPTLYTLRLTHPHFATLITPPLLQTHLLHAETTTPSRLKAQNLYPCFTCLRALPSTHFSDKSRKTPKGYGGIHARKRFCIRCGLRHHRYQPGQAVIVHNVPGVICLVCQRVFVEGRVGGVEDGFCAGHGGADEGNFEALGSLVAGREARRARRRGRGRGFLDSLDFEDGWGGGYGDGDGDGEGGSLSEEELTEEYLYEAWGYDPEC